MPPECVRWPYSNFHISSQPVSWHQYPPNNNWIFCLPLHYQSTHSTKIRFKRQGKEKISSYLIENRGFPSGSEGKASVCLQCRRPWFDPWVGKILWRRKWPGKSHGSWSLVGYRLWGHRVRHNWVTSLRLIENKMRWSCYLYHQDVYSLQREKIVTFQSRSLAVTIFTKLSKPMEFWNKILSNIQSENVSEKSFLHSHEETTLFENI